MYFRFFWTRDGKEIPLFLTYIYIINKNLPLGICKICVASKTPKMLSTLRSRNPVYIYDNKGENCSAVMLGTKTGTEIPLLQPEDIFSLLMTA